jgi:hypothetical protein
MTEKNEQFGECEVELYDHEMVRVRDIHQQLNDEFARRDPYANPLIWYELQERAKDLFYKIGLIVEVHITKALLGQGGPEVVVMRRVPGHQDNTYGHDHELKKIQVLESKRRGEKFLGEKDGKSFG